MFLDNKNTFYVVVLLSASFLIGGMITAPVVSKIYADPDTKFFKKENIKIQYDKKYKHKHHNYDDRCYDNHHNKYKDKHHEYNDRCYDNHHHKYYKDHKHHDNHHHKYYKDHKHHDNHHHKYYKDHENYKHDREYHKY